MLREAAKEMQDVLLKRRLVARFKETPKPDPRSVRIASRYFEDRYAKRLMAMSLAEAKEILGFPPSAAPSADEISKAYKRKAIENHPDRGGDPKKMVDINVAKDILDGKQRPTPGGGSAADWVRDWYRNSPGGTGGGYTPPKEKPKPREPDVTIEGQSFADALSSSGIPANVEWKFVSIPEWYWETTSHPGHRVWTLYGQTDQKHVFLALKERGESSGGIYIDSKFTKIMQDWQSSEVDVPISQNISKIAPKYLKMTGTAWTDAKPKPPRKFVAWPGGKPTEAILHKIPRTGGAALKDILLGTGLLADEDPAVAGRKSVVEVYTKYSSERYERYKKRKAEGKTKYVTKAHQYDFFVRVNGKTEQLEDETIEKMERVFIPWVMNWEVTEGAPKNLTRMRGGRFKHGPAEAIEELVNCLTGEPSWLHIALEKAAEEYQEPTKTAQLLNIRQGYTLLEAAKIAGMTPYELFCKIHGDL